MSERRRRVHRSTLPPEIDEIEVVEHLVLVPETPDFHKHPAFDGFELLARHAQKARAAIAVAALALCLAAPAAASDFMHFPALCRYHQESHAVAGGIVGAIVNYTADSYGMRTMPRLIASTVAALAVGTFKEYLVDHHARPSEIPAWGVGGAVVSLAWSWRF